MTRKKLYLLSLLSGGMFVLSWPPYGIPFLLFVAFIPILMIEHAISSGQFTGKRTILFGLSYLAFFIWNVSTTFWVCNASIGGGVMAILANSFIMAAVVWTFHIVKTRLLTSNFKLQTLNWLFPIFWLAYEFFHHRWELTWPWLGLGNAFASIPSVVQWYEYTGTCGGSLWVLAVNMMVFGLMQNGKSGMEDGIPVGRAKKMVGLGLIIFIPVVLSLIRYTSYEEKPDPVNIVVVQPNIDPYSEKFSTMNFKEQLDRMLELAKQEVDSTTDYLIFPETALTEDIWENEIQQTASVHHLRTFVRSFPKLKIIAGAATAYLYDPGQELSVTARKFKNMEGYYDQYNTAIQVDSSKNIQVYHKSKLVPGVERMPYPILFGFLEKLAIDLGGTSGSLATQEERSVFTSPNPLIPVSPVHIKEETEKGRTGDPGSAVVAPVICYESIFGEFVTEYVKKGANLILIITNDGWWGNTPGFKQHLQYGGLRAIETRRSIARSANTGISCFINQRGDVLQATEWWKPAVIKGSINLNTDETFYMRNGDIIWRVSFYVSIIVLLYTFAMLLRARFETK